MILAGYFEAKTGLPEVEVNVMAVEEVTSAAFNPEGIAVQLEGEGAYFITSEEVRIGTARITEAEANKLLAEIAVNKGVVLLDKADYICDMKSGTCDGITDEGYKTFYDYGHYTLEGAKYFGRRMYEINWLGID